jgi:hypothetical protein
MEALEFCSVGVDLDWQCSDLDSWLGTFNKYGGMQERHYVIHSPPWQPLYSRVSFKAHPGCLKPVHDTGFYASGAAGNIMCHRRRLCISGLRLVLCVSTAVLILCFACSWNYTYPARESLSGESHPLILFKQMLNSPR